MKRSPCSVDGCDRAAEIHGWCRGHHQRWKRTGDPGSAQFRAKHLHRQPCSVDGCDGEAHAHGWCKAHYRRWQMTGAVGDTPIARTRRRPAMPCAVDGCDKPSTSRGWCHGHYKRWWDSGDTGPAEFAQYGVIEVCSAPGCDRKHRTKGWCDMHYRRAKAGIPTDSLKFLTMPKPRRAEITYHIAHGQIVAERGRASDYLCSCGEPAKDWAYQHNDPDALSDERGYFYSLKFYECYEPMCRSCHNLLDRDADRRAAAAS